MSVDLDKLFQQGYYIDPAIRDLFYRAKAEWEEIENIVREFANKQDGDKCHYYPEIFERLAQKMGIEIEAKVKITREEFEKGCRLEQLKLFGPDPESIKKFREITGLTLMDCKVRLIEAGGNLEEALKKLLYKKE